MDILAVIASKEDGVSIMVIYSKGSSEDGPTEIIVSQEKRG